MTDTRGSSMTDPSRAGRPVWVMSLLALAACGMLVLVLGYSFRTIHDTDRRVRAASQAVDQLRQELRPCLKTARRHVSELETDPDVERYLDQSPDWLKKLRRVRGTTRALRGSGIDMSMDRLDEHVELLRVRWRAALDEVRRCRQARDEVDKGLAQTHEATDAARLWLDRVSGELRLIQWSGRRLDATIPPELVRRYELNQTSLDDALSSVLNLCGHIDEVEMTSVSLSHVTREEQRVDLHANGLVPALARLHREMTRLDRLQPGAGDGRALAEAIDAALYGKDHTHDSFGLPRPDGKGGYYGAVRRLLDAKAQRTARLAAVRDSLDQAQVDVDTMIARAERTATDVTERSATAVHRAIVLALGLCALVLVVFLYCSWRMARRLRHAAQNLQQARADAEAANRAKSQFLANMSHEIRTPMTAILGYADVLADDELSAEDREEQLRIIRRNGHHLLSLINDILDLSKIEAGKLEIERAEMSLWRVVDEVVALMRVRAIDRGLHLSAEFVFPIPETIQCDAGRVRQILMNLVGNAIKFTESGGVRVIVRVARTSQDPRIACEVVDTGIGMTPEQITRLFKPFSQADASMSRKYGGTGLGLTVSKRLAQALGGDITVQSTPGEGSSFVLTIDPGPLDDVRMIEDARECGQDSESQPEPDAAAERLSGRVLLAEDGPDNQRLISFVLRKAGLDVDVAENGEIALAMYEQAQGQGRGYDVILMDMQMPVMDGYTATRKLRRAGATVPVVALTAHAMTGDRDKCLSTGCNDYATKPINKPELYGLLSRYLDQPAQAA